VRFRAAGLVLVAHARARADAGELDAACAAARSALAVCVGTGSVRLLDELRRVEGRLRAAPDYGEFSDMFHSVRRLLPLTSGAASALRRDSG
jgi:hypothetical protein